MTSQELEQLIRQGEGYNLEFKQSIPSRASELAEEICAFANAAGGTLLIGVDNSGKVIGIRIWEKESFEKFVDFWFVSSSEYGGTNWFRYKPYEKSDGRSKTGSSGISFGRHVFCYILQAYIC